MIARALEGVGMFPGFEGVRQLQSFVAKQPMFFCVSMCGDDPIPLLFDGADANFEGELIACALAIVANQFHGDKGRIELEEQFFVEFFGHLIDMGVYGGDKCELHHSFVKEQTIWDLFGFTNTISIK
jgi:hypothetical protein